MNLKDNVLLDEVMDNIAHQWRQPLSQVNANVLAIDDILYKLGIEDSRIEERLSEIETLTKYMSQTIDDFKGGKKRRDSVRIADLVEEIKKIFILSIREYHIDLDVDIKNNFVFHGSEGELFQVILVILNNAKDALVERNVYGKKISIAITLEDDFNVISIIDNAGGITKKNIEKIFENDYTTKHETEGSGIGLGMARKIIVDDFKGKLSVENLNLGSCFKIKLNLF